MPFLNLNLGFWIWLLPVIGGVLAIIIIRQGRQVADNSQGTKQSPLLLNRDGLFKAIHQLKDTASEVIISSLSLSNQKERGIEPHQSSVNQFSAAFDNYKEAHKELECQELIAAEVFHDPINIFRTEIDSCVQNPAPPEKVTNSLVVNINTEENSNKLYDALNEVISKLNEISQ